MFGQKNYLIAQTFAISRYVNKNNSPKHTYVHEQHSNDCPELDIIFVFVMFA